MMKKKLALRKSGRATVRKRKSIFRTTFRHIWCLP